MTSVGSIERSETNQWDNQRDLAPEEDPPSHACRPGQRSPMVWVFAKRQCSRRGQSDQGNDQREQKGRERLAGSLRKRYAIEVISKPVFPGYRQVSPFAGSRLGSAHRQLGQHVSFGLQRQQAQVSFVLEQPRIQLARQRPGVSRE